MSYHRQGAAPFLLGSSSAHNAASPERTGRPERVGIISIAVLAAATIGIVVGGDVDIDSLMAASGNTAAVVLLTLGLLITHTVGQLDLSTTGVAMLCAVWLSVPGHQDDRWVVLGIVGAAAIAGLIGWVLHYFESAPVPSLLALLGLRSLAQAIEGQGPGRIGTKGVLFQLAERGMGTSYGFVIVVALMTSFVIHYSDFGRRIRARGADRRSISSTNPHMLGTVAAAHALTGLCVGLGAVLLVADTRSTVSPSADNLLLWTIAALVIGNGGASRHRPSVSGVVCAATLLSLFAGSQRVVGVPPALIALSVAIAACATLAAAAAQEGRYAP